MQTFIFLLGSSELLILKWVCSNCISCTDYVAIVIDFCVFTTKKKKIGLIRIFSVFCKECNWSFGRLDLKMLMLKPYDQWLEGTIWSFTGINGVCNMMLNSCSLDKTVRKKWIVLGLCPHVHIYLRWHRNKGKLHKRSSFYSERI